ncbi:MAG: flippase-like domain-containing protein [Methanobacteriaceae archaeon]|nr:flippase-like domain-containing protein [Methanobacteriaceae archaeon]
MAESNRTDLQTVYSFILDNKYAILISFIIVFLLIFAMVALSGLNSIINNLGRTNLLIFAFTFVIQIVVILLWAYRWKLILYNMHDTPSFSNVVAILLTSIFGNNITPGAIGGEPLRAYILREYNGTPFEVGFASTMADRVFEMFPFIIISLLAIISIITWNLSLMYKIVLLFLIFAVFALFLIVIYTGFNKAWSINLATKIIDFFFPYVEKISKKTYDYDHIINLAYGYIDNFNHSFRMMVENRSLFIKGIFLAMVCWALDLSSSYLAFIAIGIHPPIAPFITVYTIAILLSFLPTLPGSLGITEIIMILLFVPVGIFADQVLAAAALERVAHYVFPTVLGILASLYYFKNFSKKRLEKKQVEMLSNEE